MLNERVIAQKIAAEFRSALEEVGQEVEDEMRRLCPVDTGFLRSTIGHEVNDFGDGLVLHFYARAKYAIYVDKGTSRMLAQPFFTPPLIGLKERIEAKLGDI